MENKDIERLIFEISEIKENARSSNNRLNAGINKLNKTFDDLKKPYKSILTCVLFIAILLIGLFIVLNRVIGVGLSDNSIMVTFIGIISAFIVINNYMQTIEIKRELKREFKHEVEKVKEITDKLDTKICDIKTEINDAKKGKNNIDNLYVGTVIKLVCCWNDNTYDNRYFLVGIDAITYGLKNDASYIDFCIKHFILKFQNKNNEINQHRVDSLLEAANRTKYHYYKEVSDIKDFVANLKVSEVKIYE